MNTRENLIRAYLFQTPEWIPISVGIPPTCWNYYDREEFVDILSEHKILFPDYQKELEKLKKLEDVPWQRSEQNYTDSYGCVLHTEHNSVHGRVIKSPLESWDDFGNFQMPNPEFQDGMQDLNWKDMAIFAQEIGKKDEFLAFGLPHGHTFLRLLDLRGYENLMFDMLDENPNLQTLIGKITEFNVQLIQKYLSLNPDMIYVPEDLGMQDRAMLSPTLFKKYIKPSYRAIMQPIKNKNIIAHMHSDGHILELMDDLIECGCDVINLQDLVNGIDQIEKELKGRIAIDLDIDRQAITVSGTPKEIDEHIHECVRKLGSREGGLFSFLSIVVDDSD